MRSKNPLQLLWLVPLLVAALASLGSAAAHGEVPCALTLGQANVQLGATLGNELEILSWNIQKASNAGWAEDLTTFAEGVDLAFIQEASIEARIPEALSLHSNFARGYTTPGRETGVMTLSSSTPSVHCKLTSMEPWLGTPKATSVTEYPLENREERLLAINLHAINFDLGLQRFHSQFEALRALLDRHEGPVIVAGDLNTWSDSRQTLVDTFMQEHGLGSVLFEPDLRTTTFGRALDHIYIRGLHASDARVIPVSSSDHNPLRVRLGFL